VKSEINKMKRPKRVNSRDPMDLQGTHLVIVKEYRKGKLKKEPRRRE